MSWLAGPSWSRCTTPQHEWDMLTIDNPLDRILSRLEVDLSVTRNWRSDFSLWLLGFITKEKLFFHITRKQLLVARSTSISGCLFLLIIHEPSFYFPNRFSYPPELISTAAIYSTLNLLIKIYCFNTLILSKSFNSSSICNEYKKLLFVHQAPKMTLKLARSF